MSTLSNLKSLITELESEIKERGLENSRDEYRVLESLATVEKNAMKTEDLEINPNAGSASLPEVRLDYKDLNSGDTMASASCHTVPFEGSMKAKEILTRSGTLLKWDHEDHDRLFQTKRDNRRVRTLKSLRLLPKGPKIKTFAEIGIQVDLEDHKACKQELEQFNEQTKTVSRLVEECRSRSETILMLRGHVEEFQKLLGETNAIVEKDLKNEQEARKTAEETAKKANDKLNQITKELLDVKCTLQHVERSKEETEKELKDINTSLEKKELDSAFLLEEKEDAEKLAKDRWEKLEKLNKRYMEMEEQRDDFQALYTHAKAEYSNTLGRYLAKLNSALEDKRYLIKKGAKSVAMETKPAEALKTAELFLEREEENCKLVEQIEYLSSQSVAQDLKIQQLLEELDDYKDICQCLFASDGQLKGTQEAELIKKRLIRRYNSENHRVLGDLIDICSRLSGVKAQKQEAQQIREAGISESEDLTSCSEMVSDGELSEASSRVEEEAASGDAKLSTSPIKRLIGILKKPVNIPILETESEEESPDDTRSTDADSMSSCSPRKSPRLTWKDQAETQSA